MRPRAHCTCNLLAPFRLHCNLLILQHPKERRKYYGTAKIIEKSVRNARVEVGQEFSADILSPALGSGAAYLLFPGSGATQCSETNLERDSTLIVLDGTWSQANNMLRRSELLRTVPQISFSNEYISRYRIRGQPKAKCLSTIEAVAYYLIESSLHLTQLERSSRIRSAYSLLEAFKVMVERQLACWKSWQPRPHDLEYGTNWHAA